MFHLKDYCIKLNVPYQLLRYRGQNCCGPSRIKIIAIVTGKIELGVNSIFVNSKDQNVRGAVVLHVNRTFDALFTESLSHGVQ